MTTIRGLPIASGSAPANHVLPLEHVPLRVKNPVQKPSTAPRTMENCSRAISEPRTSGGLISAIYSGASILVFMRQELKVRMTRIVQHT